MKLTSLPPIFFILVTSTGWANEEIYTDVLPGILCETTQYFTSCFETTPKQCTKLMKEFAEKCITGNQNYIQKIKKQNSSVSQKKTAVRIKIGSCMGELYEKKQFHLKVDSKKCFSEKDWSSL